MLSRCLLGILLLGIAPAALTAPANDAPVRQPPTRPTVTPDPADTEAAPPSEETPSEETPAAPEPAKPEETKPEENPPAPPANPVTNWLEAQVELSRRGFSCGSIDGVRGLQTVAALKAFQRNEGLRETGDLDKSTRQVLALTAPALTEHTLTTVEFAQVKPLPDTYLEKSQQTSLGYTSVLELVAELYHANPGYLKKLNPGIDWTAVLPGAVIKVPAVGLFTTTLKAAKIHISLSEHTLEATDETGRIIVHFPVSIARNVEKRPVGELHVIVVIPDPDYTLDPEVFPESAEMQKVGHKLILPPGPNNPVGVAWIGLDRVGYGMHGTPDPEKVGRTESHGCFRLANWDARALLNIAWVGQPVIVEP
jgi:lipoprotein-anchoring transpeptidase ErfK/SrfK